MSTIIKYPNGAYTIALETFPNPRIATLHIYRKSNGTIDTSDAVISLPHSRTTLENVIAGNLPVSHPKNRKKREAEKYLQQIQRGNILQHLAYTLLYEQGTPIDHPEFHSPEFHPLKKREVDEKVDALKRKGPNHSYRLDKKFLHQLFLSYNFNRLRFYRACKKIMIPSENTRTPAKNKQLQEMTTSYDGSCFFRSTIVRLNVGLPWEMLKYANPELDPDEVLSTGMLALDRSVFQFDALRGLEFSTLACNAIRTAYLALSIKHARNNKRLPSVPLEPWMEGLRGKREEDPSKLAEEKEQINDIMEENSLGLRDREIDILKRRFSEPKELLKDIGKSQRVTPERIRQVQNGAIRKIRLRLIERKVNSLEKALPN